MRRRCLDFEMAGNPQTSASAAAHGASSIRGSSSSSSSSSSQPNQNLLSLTSSGNAFRCTLPGIGLHLNALAATLKRSDSENLCSETRPNLAPFYAPNSSQYQPLLASSTPERGSPLQEPALPIGEDLDQINPKKNRCEAWIYSPWKFWIVVILAFLFAGCFVWLFLTTCEWIRRKWIDNAGIGACKRCNCKKSRCLKL